MAAKKKKHKPKYVLLETPTFKESGISAFFISIAALILSLYLPGELTSLEVFIPKEKANDFSFSDFYTMTATNADAVSTDTIVTVVALDGCTRAQMGRAIAMADTSGVSAIGIDMIFSPPTTPYDSIVQAIDTARNVVLPVVLTDMIDGFFTKSEVSYFEPQLTNSLEHGAVNINGSHEGTTTRFFKAEFDTEEGPIPALPTVLAEMHHPGCAETLWERGNDMEMINFSGRVFNIITPDEIESHPELLRDHIVLMGYVNDRSDMHRNPLVNKIPGVLIHANTISTIVEQTYIDYSSTWINIVIAFVACFIMVFAGMHFRFRPWGAMLVRGIQIILMFGVLYAGALVYIRHSYSFEFGPTITVTILGLVVMDIVIGLSLTGRNVMKWLKSPKIAKRLARQKYPKAYNYFFRNENQNERQTQV